MLWPYAAVVDRGVCHASGHGALGRSHSDPAQHENDGRQTANRAESFASSISAGRVSRRSPLGFAGHGNEDDRQHSVALIPLFRSANEDQLLPSVADGDDHAPSDFQLSEKRLRQFWRRCGDDDRIEGRLVGPALVTVAYPDVNILVPQVGQQLS